MTTITPFSGWLLQEAVALDDACPGVIVHLLQASPERRHVVAAYLSRPSCFRQFASKTDEGRFLLAAGHNEILAAAFVTVPLGLRAALGRAGSVPHSKRYYGYLHALHNSKARPEMSRVLKSLECTGPKALRIARALPAAVRTGTLVRAIESEDVARDLAHLIRLMGGAGVDRPAMLTGLATAEDMNSVRAWARRWAFRVDLPAHPLPASINYTPVCRAEDLHKLANRFRNCARNYLVDALDGKSAFASVAGGARSAVAHLIFERGQWWLEDIYGPRNAAPDEGLVKIALSHLAEHNVLPMSHQPFTARKWSCLRRFVSHFDYHDDWDDA